MQSVLSPEDQTLLTRLEESLWIEASRFDESFMQRALAADFLQFGKSGRMHTRDAVLSATRHAIGAVLPLRELQIRLLDENTAICGATWTGARTMFQSFAASEPSGRRVAGEP